MDVVNADLKPPKPASSGWRAVVREHLVIAGVVAACVTLGAVSGAYLLTDDWSLVRRLAAGAVAGAGVGLLITAPRIIG